MSEFGLKIKNFQAGSIYEVMLGVRDNYDTVDAMLTNSLFSEFLKSIGLETNKRGTSTRDVICLKFDYGSRSADDELKHLNKLNVSAEKKEELYKAFELNYDKYQKKSRAEIRDYFYNNGVEIKYKDCTIKYRMAYRTPGKAKKGECIFICERLYEQAHNFLWMGVELPEKNAPVVEIGAYSSLITSSIVGTIQINPRDILILKDVNSHSKANVICIETNENDECYAVNKSDYDVMNTLFDGQALIDDSIFPNWGEGYILLRQHFCKVAAFRSYIQKYFKDRFGDEYETATVKDMWGNEHLVKSIKMITTENAVKWIKFKGITYDYWCDKVGELNNMFGVVKTAHQSKLGEYQRMSYQMVNSLDNAIDNVLEDTVRHIERLKNDDLEFIRYLYTNKNFSNDFEALCALVEHNNDFIRSSYFVDRRRCIIKNYVKNIKSGHIIQNADNLVIVGNPYAMLLHASGDNAFDDITFNVEDTAIQCWTERFEDGEFLAEFRSPFNSRNNLGYLHNVKHEYFDKYFKFGKQIIAVNMINTNFQDRNNGSDQDSDSIYTTNQIDIVRHAKYCQINYPTIVNNIPKDGNHYDNNMSDFAKIDNKLAAAQLDIGESSNLAQICLSYSYNFNDRKISDYVAILSVLAQVSIDSAKRAFNVNVHNEILRIRNDIGLKDNGYPMFWKDVMKMNNRNNKNYNDVKFYNENIECPMNSLYNLKIRDYNMPKNKIIDLDNFYERKNFEKDALKRKCKKVEELISKYSLEIFTKRNDEDEHLLLRNDFEELIQDLKMLNLNKNYEYLFSWLIDRAFIISPNMKKNKDTIMSNINKNKPLLLSVLYELNPEMLLKCFTKGVPPEKNEAR